LGLLPSISSRISKPSSRGKASRMALFATQRGLLYALPAGLALLISWRSRLFGAQDEREWRLPLWGEVLLYGSMPLFTCTHFSFSP